MANIYHPPCDAGVMLSGKADRLCAPHVGRWVLVATILGSSMAFIDGTVVNVALPILQEDLGATATQVQWVAQAYALFLSAFILVGGSMGDHLGRRRVFMWGVGLFALASIWCGVAPNITQLTLAQSLKGLGGAMLIPGSLAIISASFDGKERGQAIGTWAAFTAITMALGPVLGGWLVENVSWRAVFFINVPLAVIVLIISVWRVPESRDEEVVGQRLDWGGAVLAALGIGGIIYGLTVSSQLGLLHPQVLVPLLTGVLVLVLFIWLEARLSVPMLPLDIFRVTAFSGTNLLTLLLYAALGGALFYLPFNLIQVQGYSPTAAGAALLPFILLVSLLSRWSGGLVERYGARLPLIVGPIIIAVGYALFAVPGIGGTYWTTFFPAVVVLGLGMALVVAPLTTTVMNSVSTHQSGLASGTNNAVSRVAGLLGIAVMGIIMAYIFNVTLDGRLAPLDLSTETQTVVDEQRANLAGAQFEVGVEPGTQAALDRAFKESFVAGFRLVMLFAAVLALLGTATTWFMIEGKHEQVERPPVAEPA